MKTLGQMKESHRPRGQLKIMYHVYGERLAQDHKKTLQKNEGFTVCWTEKLGRGSIQPNAEREKGSETKAQHFIMV